MSESKWEEEEMNSKWILDIRIYGWCSPVTVYSTSATWAHFCDVNAWSTDERDARREFLMHDTTNFSVRYMGN